MSSLANIQHLDVQGLDVQGLDVQRALELAENFLTARQDSDGHWRDYQLAPGRSEAWVTACVGYALCHRLDQGLDLGQPQQTAVARAVDALLATRRPEGWGYNRQTACDADSTSWVIRFLARAGALQDISASDLLARYVTPSGAVRTFASADRFGSWALEHDEVAPLAGLALLAAGERELAALERAAQVRASVLKNRIAAAGWRPFWWRGAAYVSAKNLEFLSAGGGIPEAIAAAERARFHQMAPPETAFETAQRLAAAVHLDDWDAARRFGRLVLERQSSAGGWPASPALLVPSQRDPSQFAVFADDRGLLSTAMSIMALAVWLRRSLCCRGC